MAAELDLAAMSMGLLGGLSIFLFGMGQMTDALKAVAGAGMRKLLGRLTRNRFLGAFTGAFVTAVIQSLSVTTVLVVGFITAGLMSLSQSIGVIMGANVGTTITAQIIAFKVTKYAMALIAFGFFMLFAGKQEKVRQIGAMIMGLGLIFGGMGLMSDATDPLRSYQPFIEVMQSMDDPLLGMLVAAAFTALVQSSSATTGIVVVLASQGFISLEAGIALVFGANVGTCVTAVLASLGKPRAAARAAAAHVIFNVVGVLVWLGFIGYLADAVRAISPSYPGLSGSERLAAEVPRQIANAHTAFNLANTFFFIWFTVPLASLVTRLLPDKPVPIPEAAKPLYLDEIYLQTPALAVDRVRLELGHLGDLVLDMVAALRSKQGRAEGIDLRMIDERARDVEMLTGGILDYARRLSEGSLSSSEATRLDLDLDAGNQLRNIADTIGTNLAPFVREWQARQLEPSEETRRLFLAVHDLVTASIREAIEAGKALDREHARAVIEMKREVYEAIEALSDRLSARLVSGDPNRVEIYRLESRVLEIYRRMYYFAKRLAKVVATDILEEEVEPLLEVGLGPGPGPAR